MAKSISVNYTRSEKWGQSQQGRKNNSKVINLELLNIPVDSKNSKYMNVLNINILMSEEKKDDVYAFNLG